MSKVQRGECLINFESKQIYAAIFDMDGTMFDTERLRINMLKSSSKLIYGESMTDKLLLDSLGVNAKMAEELAKKQYGENYPYEDIRKKADEYEVKYIRHNGIPVKEGLYDVLERLKKSGILIALATSSRRAIAEEYLLNARVMRFFDVIVCGNEVTKGKPDPEIFLKAADELNCHPSHCLIFEDSQNGLIAAADSGGIPIFIKDIKEPEKHIKNRVFKAYNSMVEFHEDLVKFTPKMSMPKLNEHFPQSFGYVKAGIHGFGAIGGGYLTQIFSHWDGYTRPKEIIGATKKVVIKELINSLGKFNVKYESRAYFQSISNVHIIDMDDETEMIKMYTESQIIGLAIPETAVKSQSEIIAKGLIERYSKNNTNLTILVVLNKIKGAKFIRKNVKNALKNLVGEEKAEETISRTYFCETVVNRMVSAIPEKTLLTQIQKKLSNLKRTISYFQPDITGLFKYFQEGESVLINPKKTVKKIDEKTLLKVGDISKKLSIMSQFDKYISRFNVSLFSSEPYIPLYASNESPLLERLRQVKVVDNIEKMQQIKNRLSNGPHAIIAWYSALLGYKTIGQGMGDKKVLSLVRSIIEKEIKPSLIKDNSELSEYIDGFISNFIKRCRSSFKDNCIRVGRDPMRKLQCGERIFGTITLAQKFNIPTPMIEFGAACAIFYSILLINSKDKECRKIKEIYNKNRSVEDVLTYDGEYNGARYHGLNLQKDKDLIRRIKIQFNNLMLSEDIISYHHVEIDNQLSL
ncbi:bifunctional mannitol-1-phosphate dehydrogenase/phosphatase [Clostridium kluyveri]|uniref:Uncharacterized protein n=2 Tax=Clostridium kluyveri TaxID=1534 RepID=A5MZB3_CLOK5|nr:HAD family hydrolase [Clostridium kluyveri]EDK34209.1 Conserved hypothetical protein [Clostridium kluyveri DSM 555]BAH06983.1 hypothetical protein CKR_1932 [Clostridium kluyveri NBRC 12016]